MIENSKYRRKKENFTTVYFPAPLVHFSFEFCSALPLLHYLAPWPPLSFCMLHEVPHILLLCLALQWSGIVQCFPQCGVRRSPGYLASIQWQFAGKTVELSWLTDRLIKAYWQSDRCQIIYGDTFTPIFLMTSIEVLFKDRAPAQSTANVTLAVILYYLLFSEFCCMGSTPPLMLLDYGN